MPTLVRCKRNTKMKTAFQQFRNVTLVCLLILVQTGNAQSITERVEPPQTRASSFEVGTYMGENWTMNLMLAIHQSEGVTLRIRHVDNTVLYQQHLKKSRTVYHHKLNFENCKPGVYQVEISDSRQTIVRRVEVVDMPAIEAQRYITYGPQTNL